MYSELVFSHEALEPAPGTTNKNRACMPYPFTGQLTGDEASNELRLLIDGFRKSAHLGSGAAHPHLPGCRMHPAPGRRARAPRLWDGAALCWCRTGRGCEGLLHGRGAGRTLLHCKLEGPAHV